MSINRLLKQSLDYYYYLIGSSTIFFLFILLRYKIKIIISELFCRCKRCDGRNGIENTMKNSMKEIFVEKKHHWCEIESSICVCVFVCKESPGTDILYGYNNHMKWLIEDE